jgi:hypothetical protein
MRVEDGRMSRPSVRVTAVSVAASAPGAKVANRDCSGCGLCCRTICLCWECVVGLSAAPPCHSRAVELLSAVGSFWLHVVTRGAEKRNHVNAFCLFRQISALVQRVSVLLLRQVIVASSTVTLSQSGYRR